MLREDEIHLCVPPLANKCRRIGQSGLDLDVPGVLVPSRVDGRDLSAEDLVAVGIQSDFHGLTHCYLAEVLLRQTKIYVDGVERLKSDDRVASIQVLAQINLSNSYDPGKRRSQCFPGDDRFVLIDSGLRLMKF